MNEIVTRSSGDPGQQDLTSYDYSPDSGDAPTAWNHLDSLKWAQTVVYRPKLPYRACGPRAGGPIAGMCDIFVHYSSLRWSLKKKTISHDAE